MSESLETAPDTTLHIRMHPLWPKQEELAATQDMSGSFFDFCVM